jgi:hypothetical protein
MEIHPDQIFAIVNPLAALSWLALIVVPRRAAPLTGVVVPAIFAALYAALIAANWSGADGGFSSLPDVGAAVRQPLAAAGRLGALPVLRPADRDMGGAGRADARHPAPAGRAVPRPNLPVRARGLAVV